MYWYQAPVDTRQNMHSLVQEPYMYKHVPRIVYNITEKLLIQNKNMTEMGEENFEIFKLVKYKKRLLLRCIHHFKSDLIYNMDHMHISGTEPSSVILSETKYKLIFHLNFRLSWNTNRF